MYYAFVGHIQQNSAECTAHTLRPKSMFRGGKKCIQVRKIWVCLPA